VPTQLHAIGASVPGFKGLQLQSASSYLSPEWATVADNFIFDDAGRLAARKGYTILGDTSTSVEIEQIAEHISAAGVGTRIFSTATGLYSESAGAVTDRTGALTIDDGNWKFQTWNDGSNQLILGLNNDNSTNKYVQSTGGAAFTAVSVTGTAPTGSDFIVAWGRAFGLHANDTILKWSVVIDHTDFNGVGSGTLNLYNVFSEGMDRAIAIAPFNNQLIIFGRNNILIYGASDATRGSVTTDYLDPNDMVLIDTIHGTGCVARDSVQNVGTDIVFLSASGLQSLGRLIQERSAPMSDESKNVRDSFIADIRAQSDKSVIRSCYSEVEGIYLITFPDLPTPKVYCFDMRFRLEDGSRRVTIWNQIKPTALFVSRLEARTMYMAQLTAASTWDITTYSGTDDNGTDIPVRYESGWVVLSQGEQYIIPKNISGTFVATGSQPITFIWAFDFQDKYKSFTKLLTSSGSASVYGTATWNVSTYTTGVSIQGIKTPMRGYGETIKYGFLLTPTGTFAANKLELHSKLGRIN